MKQKLYTCKFEVHKPEGFTILNEIPNLQELMENELIRCYSIFSKKSNSERVIEKLNSEFESRYPNYFDDNKGKEFWELTEYNKFVADGMMKNIVNEMNSRKESQILEFHVLPEDLQFVGHLRADNRISIEFWLKEA